MLSLLSYPQYLSPHFLCSLFSFLAFTFYPSALSVCLLLLCDNFSPEPSLYLSSFVFTIMVLKSTILLLGAAYPAAALPPASINLLSAASSTSIASRLDIKLFPNVHWETDTQVASKIIPVGPHTPQELYYGAGGECQSTSLQLKRDE